MELSKRLQAVAGLVSNGNRLVDVGTDHGYIPIYLVQKGVVPSAIAMDVRKGPLSRAEEHIAKAGLGEYITCRLSDGLEKLEAGEGDSLILAGMGGNLMVRILLEKPQVLMSFRELILQPQSAQYLVRKTMEENGWETVFEDMIFEDGKYYPMMRLVQGNVNPDGKAPLVKEAEYTYGKLLLKEKNPVLKEYLLKQQILCKKIKDDLLGRLSEKTSDSVEGRLRELEHEMEILEAALGFYAG